MPRRFAVALFAVALLAGCGSSPKKMSVGDVERLLEGNNGPNVLFARLDQVRDLRFIEVAQLDAIKPPVVLQPDYLSMVAGIKAVGDDELQLRDALASGTAATRRSALADRRRAARQPNEIALRLGLRGCADAAVRSPGITS